MAIINLVDNIEDINIVNYIPNAEEEEKNCLDNILNRIKTEELTAELFVEIQNNCRLFGIDKTFKEDLNTLNEAQIGTKIMNNVLFCSVRYIIRLAKNYSDLIYKNYSLMVEINRLKLEIAELRSNNN
jgi:hypothetical protein